MWLPCSGHVQEQKKLPPRLDDKSNRIRYRDVTGKSAANLSNSADYYGFGEELTAAENLAGLQKQLLKLGKDTKGSAIELQDRLELAGTERGEKKTQAAALRAATAELASRGIISPQAGAGLDPESGAARVSQRAGGNNTGGFQMPANLRDSEGLPATERLRRLQQRDAIDAAIIAQDVDYGSRANQDARAWQRYNAQLNAYNRKEDRLNALQDAEAAYQFKRDQQRMDHEQRQFEIRETNKMLKAQYEKELEIEESRRRDADFDNLTRMIMGMAGNL